MSYTDIAHTRHAWLSAFTLGDQLAIDALPEAVRDVVERYVRHSGGHGTTTDEYEDGFDAGVQAMKDEIDCAYPSSGRRRRKQ